MTEDITRGLALLAEEAAPAAIDSHAVVATVKARKRNRRAVATAFATVAAIGALTMALITDRAPGTATTEEGPSARLNAQLAIAVPDVIPPGWQTAPAPTYRPTAPPLQFGCGSETVVPFYPSAPAIVALTTGYTDGHDSCRAEAWYQDAQGPIELWIEVGYPGMWSYSVCNPAECDEWALPSGTRVRVNVETVGMPPPGHLQQFEALQSNGTHIRVTTHWQNDRSTPPLTVDELVSFADRFEY